MSEEYARRSTTTLLGPGHRNVAELDREEVRRELLRWFQEAGDGELRVLLYCARRFVGLGQAAYGRLDLSSKARDMRKELSEELTDAVFYAAVSALRDYTGGE